MCSTMHYMLRLLRFARSGITLLFCFALCLTSPRATAKESAREHLENLGFTPLQASPIDFELSDLQGGTKSLKSFRGKWVIIAFWATWCGPCAEEMPALETIYREFKNRGFSVIGVSVDQDRSSVEAFLKEKQLTFPILLDADGAVSSKYRASALPTLYMVSADWKLVGVMRGARDWSSPGVRKDLALLVKIREIKDDDAGIKMVEGDGALELPNNLLPPEISAGFEEKEFNKGERRQLTVSVTWKGNSKDYLIKVPKLTLPNGISIQGDIYSSSTSENERTILRYHFPLTLEKEGNHKIGPIELAYSPRAGGKELFSRNEGVTITVEKKGWVRIVVPIVCGIALVCLGGIALAKRGTKRSAVVDEVTIAGRRTKRDWDESFDKIRQMKMRGETREYMISLVKLNLEIDEMSGLKNPAELSLLEKLQFGGHDISDTELVSFEKKIERAIKDISRE